MEYRKIGNDKISSLGLGLGCSENMSRTELVQTVRTARKHGISLFNLDPLHAASFEAFGEAVSGFRRDVFLLVHFDLDYSTDVRKVCSDAALAFASAAGQMQLMRVDYIDAAVIGCGTETDRQVWDQVKELKAGGVIHHVVLAGTDLPALQGLFDPSFMDMLLAGDVLYSGSGEALSTISEPADLKALHDILKNFGKAGEDKQ